MNRYLTTRNLRERYGIPRHISVRWAKRLGVLAQKSFGRWYFDPLSIPFLQSRKGKVGAPRKEPSQTQRADVIHTWRQEKTIVSVSRKLRISRRLARRWLVEMKLLNV